ncbi:MAG: OmpA family protein [Leadbetterella sp.]
MNLFEQFEEIIDDNYISKIQSIIPDNNKDQVRLAVNGVFHTLLAGMIRKTSSDMSMGMLFNQVNENYRKVGYINDFSEKFKDKDYVENIKVDGSKIISQIFPAYKSPLLSLIGSYAGVNKEGALLCSTLISLVLVEICGHKVQSSGMDKTVFGNLLREHHEPLFERMPDGLPEKMIPALGLQELTNIKGFQLRKAESAGVRSLEEKSSEAEIVDDTFEEGPVFNKKILLILAAVLSLGLIGYLVYLNKDSIPFLSSNKSSTSQSEMEALDSLNQSSDTSKIKTDTLKVSKVDSIQNSSISDYLSLASYVRNPSEVKGKEFDIKKIMFVGETININEDAKPTLDSIANLMKTHPNLQIKISAFSSTGDSKLNNKRAFAVKNFLLNTGIDGIKIDAVSGGKGPDYPKIKVITK